MLRWHAHSERVTAHRRTAHDFRYREQRRPRMEVRPGSRPLPAWWLAWSENAGLRQTICYKGANLNIDADTNRRITLIPLDDSTVPGHRTVIKGGVRDGQF